jgi:hypothetical protein
VYDRTERSMTLGNSIGAVKERPDQIWTKELNLVQTYYGRLVYLAGLLDPNTGRYEHYAFSSQATSAQANRVLQDCHESTFREWVSCPLRHKMADIESYISGLDSVDKEELIDAWLRLTPYKNLVPASIQGPERQRHVSDFEAILGLLKNVYGVASPDRDA